MLTFLCAHLRICPLWTSGYPVQGQIDRFSPSAAAAPIHSDLQMVAVARAEEGALVLHIKISSRMINTVSQLTKGDQLSAVRHARHKKKVPGDCMP